MGKITNWKSAATQEANFQNVDVNIVLATIDAETQGNNELGDSGSAMGYGQVWPAWHRDTFQYAANRLGLTLPSTKEGLQQLVLGNDTFSMIMTVCCIKQFWVGAKKDWRQFTLSYVGPAIPPDDYRRRENIWLRYQGGSSTSNYQGGLTDDNKNSITGMNDTFNVNIPASNYGVVKGSEVQKGVLYGRRYRVLVSDLNGQALDVSQLRCTFNLEKTMITTPNAGEVTIYNLNAKTENQLIKEGMRIVVEAGYEGDQYGKIFDADILQPIREKVDGTTYKLTLTCMDSDRYVNFGFANFSLFRGQSLRKVTEEIASRVKLPNVEGTNRIGSVSKGLNDAKLTRGKVVFGMAKDYLRQIAQSNKSNFYMEDGKINIINVADYPEGEIIKLSPRTGLVGTPAQNEQGLTARCLMNPRIKTNTLVQIDNSLIRAQATGTTPPLRQLDGDGIYRVIKVTYIGDTRGNDWYVEFDAINQAGLIPSMLQNGTQNGS